jgi:hypothetical protein
MSTIADLCETPAAATRTVVLRDEERQRCEVWTRVMGYHRPLASFNTGKKGEFHERNYFTERSCKPCLDS